MENDLGAIQRRDHGLGHGSSESTAKQGVQRPSGPPVLWRQDVTATDKEPRQNPRLRKASLRLRDGLFFNSDWLINDIYTSVRKDRGFDEITGPKSPSETALLAISGLVAEWTPL